MYGGDIIALAMIAGVGWSWVKWFGKQERIRPPAWRSILAIIGFGLATVSVGMEVSLTVITHIRGFFQFYDPTWLAFIKYGLLISFFGLLCGTFGKNFLRIPAIAWSGFMLLNWFGQGLSQ